MRTITGLSIIGQIEKLDFRDVRFVDCSFVDAMFVNCDVNSGTIFDKCTFSGTLELTPPSPWSAVRVLPNCAIRSSAALTLSSVLAKPTSDPDDLLIDAFRLGLGKFWHNGSPRDNIKRDDWKRGLLGRTKYCEPVLKSLIKSGVVEESKKGHYSDSRLIFSKECFGDLQRFMDNRQLTGRIADAFHASRKQM